MRVLESKWFTRVQLGELMVLKRTQVLWRFGTCKNSVEYHRGKVVFAHLKSIMSGPSMKYFTVSANLFAYM